MIIECSSWATHLSFGEGVGVGVCLTLLVIFLWKLRDKGDDVDKILENIEENARKRNG